MKNEPDWIEWEDGEEDCPVPNGNDVEVKFRDGLIKRDSDPQGWNWYNSPLYKVYEDIIAYRDWTAFGEQQKMAEQCWTATMKHQAASEVASDPEWIKWEGGTFAAPTGFDLEIKLRNGSICKVENIDDWYWHVDHDYPSSRDIVAYRCWKTSKQQESKMTGQQFKHQRNHPASALAEQIYKSNIQSKQEYASVINLLASLTRDQQLFALGYLTAKL